LLPTNACDALLTYRFYKFIDLSACFSKHFCLVIVIPLLANRECDYDGLNKSSGFLLWIFLRR